MSLLEEVSVSARRLAKSERELAEAIIRYRSQIEYDRERLDTEMVYAVDWGGHSQTEVALVAGYKSHAAIRDARKRIEKREAEVR